ncbi:MAG TPA: ABC transporter ATP-binding protein [Actinomycetes bacterium]|nr:ABC transporter ATP-binding protein [Actinomycetes bacterium]
MTQPAVTSEQVLAAAAGAIHIDHVTKRFDQVTAVDDVDLEIGAGEFFSLLGPSGCGKTTTLRLVAGFELPSAGRILVGDEDITQRRPAKRPLNMVFQDYALFPHLTVSDNIAFGLKIKRLSRAEISERVAEVIGTMRLEGLVDRRPTQLSGGQRQRVALARALVNRPRALLLDEPLGALDLQLRKQMQSELRRVHQQTRTTFLYVTHDQEEALTMSDRIAVISQGRVEQLADPRTMYERPSTAFVAEFIGTSNVLVLQRCAVTRDLLHADLGDGQRLTARVTAEQAMPGPAASVQVTVRPERITLHTEAPGALDPGDSLVRGVVSDLVYLGSLTQVSVELPGGELLVVRRMSDDASIRSVRPGDPVVATWAPEGAHVIGPTNPSSTP